MTKMCCNIFAYNSYWMGHIINIFVFTIQYLCYLSQERAGSSFSFILINSADRQARYTPPPPSIYVFYTLLQWLISVYASKFLHNHVIFDIYRDQFVLPVIVMIITVMVIFVFIVCDLEKKDRIY